MRACPPPHSTAIRACRAVSRLNACQGASEHPKSVQFLPFTKYSPSFAQTSIHRSSGYFPFSTGNSMRNMPPKSCTPVAAKVIPQSSDNE
jgi:hypothetical protein